MNLSQHLRRYGLTRTGYSEYRMVDDATGRSAFVLRLRTGLYTVHPPGAKGRTKTRWNTFRSLGDAAKAARLCLNVPFVGFVPPGSSSLRVEVDIDRTISRRG
jgi:hypothetical protein